MKISDAGINLIKEFEGCRLEAYQCPAGVWTIGIGHTGYVDGVPVGPGMKITTAKAELLLLTTLATRYEPAVNNLGVSLNQNQHDALVSFCYNLGPYIFKGALLEAIKKRDWNDVTRQMLLYNKATDPKTGKKVILSGLDRRRKAEVELFLKPVKEDTYVIKKKKVKLNGVIKDVNSIEVDGNNYVKLQDIADHWIKVDYDSIGKIPVIEAR